MFYKVKYLCFLFEKLSNPQSKSGFIEQAGRPVLSFVEGDVKGSQALDGSCSPHPSANVLEPHPLRSICVHGWCICA